MRYFIIKDGGTVIEKRAFCGNDEQINLLIEKYKTNHPTYTVEEVNVVPFDAAVTIPPPTDPQRAWALFKASNPTPAQGIVFLAKHLGLE